jgi:hypothetical protein
MDGISVAVGALGDHRTIGGSTGLRSRATSRSSRPADRPFVRADGRRRDSSSRRRSPAESSSVLPIPRRSLRLQARLDMARDPAVAHAPLRPCGRLLALVFPAVAAFVAVGAVGTYRYLDNYWVYRGFSPPRDPAFVTAKGTTDRSSPSSS